MEECDDSMYQLTNTYSWADANTVVCLLIFTMRSFTY